MVSVSGWPNLPAATPVTDSLGNTYNIAGTVLTTQGAYSAIYYARNVKGGADTVTFRTVASGGQISMVVAEFAGVDPNSPVDAVAGTTGIGTAPSSGSMTSTMNGDLVIGSGTHNGNTVTSPGSGFTMIAVPTEDSNSHQPLAMEYQILNASQQTTVAAFNLAVGFNWSQNGVLFKPGVSQGPDLTPPVVPTGLTATPYSTTQINLTWAASVDPSIIGQTTTGVAGYQLFRDGTQIASTTATTYSSTGLQASTTYSYTVASFDGAGNVSAQSSPVYETTPVTDSNPPPGFAFVDEFNGSVLDSTLWVAMNRPGDSSNNEQQYYLPTNAAVSDGLLTITSKLDSSKPGYRYTSEMIQWKSFNFTYGTIEFKARMAGGQGPWPAVWMLGSNCQQTNVNSADNIPPCNWPQPGSDEIDVTEILNSNPTQIFQGIHSGSYNLGCNVSTSDTSKNWHTYGLIWAPGSLTWLIDGVMSCRVTTGVPSTPMFLMVNTAMGGSGGSINDSTLPQTLLLDYIRVSPYDTVAPTVPTGLSATAVSTSQINLSWSPSTDNNAVAGYKIFRNGTQITTVSGTTYNNTGLSPSTTYTYIVSAYDAAGNNSAQSTAASATTLSSTDTTAPTVPTGLSATAVSTSQINLSWSPSSDNTAVVGYKIFRNGTQITTVSGTTYNNTGLSPSTTYTYIVSAYDAAGNNSAQSTAASATTLSSTDTTAPTVPTGLSATAVSTSQINLSWSPSSDNTAVVGYKIFRNGTQITTVSGTTYNNTGLRPSTTYKYIVSAYDAAGNNSAQSTAASATTQVITGNIVLVQQTSNITSSAQNLSKALPSRVTAGNLIVVSLSGWPNLPAATAVTDSLGNTYSIAGTVLTSQGAYSGIYYAKNVIGGNDTITVRTVKSGGEISMVVAEFSGVDTISPLDRTAGATGTGSTPSSGNMTPSLAGDLAIGSGTHNGTTVTTAGTGFTMVAIATETSNNRQPLAMEYQVLTGTPQTAATFRLGASIAWTQNGALFKHK